MKPLYITFDPYYDVEAYNSFLIASKNNGVEWEEYLRIRQPHHRYLKINNRVDLPSFLNYDFADATDKKFLVSLLKPVYPNEALMLKRKPGQDALYGDYITPKPLKNLENKKYIMVFKAKSFSELSEYSKKLGKSKIYKWGKAKVKGFNIYYCFNPYIKGIVPESKILMEFGEQATTGMKFSKAIPKIKGELEYMLNYFVLIKEKLEDKTYEAEYWTDGSIVPLKRTKFL